MNYNFLLMLTAGTAAVALVYLTKKIQGMNKAIGQLQEKKKRFTIAIMSPSITMFVAEITRPFIAYIRKYASFEFETIECIHNMDRDQAHEWANYIAENNADLIFAVGKFSTDVMYNTIKTRHTKIPMISAGVPVGYNDTSPEIMQANTPLTAVSTQLDWPEKIGFLKKILPYAKNVLIIFRSIDEMSHNNLKEKNTITASLRKVHIAWKMHHVSNIEKSSDLSAQLLEGVDIIVLSRSSEILRHASRIASEAAQFNVPVFSSDINCPDVFLAISECPERAIGIQSAKYAIEILEDGMYASDLPLKEIRDRKKIFIHPHTTSPIIATTAIGNLLSHCNHINITIAAPARIETKNT